jgi:Tfp pilus assembly protein PilO
MLSRLNLDLSNWRKDPRILVRLGLAVLLVANLVAAAVVFKPWASSVEDLERQAAALRQQVRQKQSALERTQVVVSKVQSARTDGDRFMDKYLLGARSMASTLVQELERMARKAGIRQKDTTFSFEPVEGSDTLTKVAITAVYEGSYADLMHFLNLLDRSERFLILESLGAAPQQGGLLLGVTMKLSALIQEGGELPAEFAARPEAPAPPAAPPPPKPRATVVSTPPPSPPGSVFAPPAPARTSPTPLDLRRGRATR